MIPFWQIVTSFVIGFNFGLITMAFVQYYLDDEGEDEYDQV